jgi:hypothetical protein
LTQNSAQFCATFVHVEGWPRPTRGGNDFTSLALFLDVQAAARAGTAAKDMARKLIGFDEDTFGKLTQLGRDRMATLQELADEAFADLLRKHGIPIDLKDALRKSAKRLNVASDHTPSDLAPSDLATSRGAKKRNRKAK